MTDEISYDNLSKKENLFPSHTLMAVGKDCVRVRQEGYATMIYDLETLGEAIENCPDDVKRWVVLNRAYDYLLKLLKLI